MSLLDRFRGRSAGAAASPGWDDGDGIDLVADLAALATSTDPGPADVRVTSSRAAVLGAFAARAAAAPGPGEAGPEGIGPRRPAADARRFRFAGSVAHRPALLVALAVVLLGAGVGTVRASAAGGPLYDLRVSSEELFLPASPDARIRAQVRRLATRLDEATAAESGGDQRALRAALGAYARIAEAAGIGAGSGPDSAIAAQVRRQIERLGQIGSSDPMLVRLRTRAQDAGRTLLGEPRGPDGAPGPEPGGASGPGGPGATALPGPRTGPVPRESAPAAGPNASARPRPAASPRDPAATPRRSDASPAPGGDPGSGTPGGGAGTPGPGDGSDGSGGNGPGGSGPSDDGSGGGSGGGGSGGGGSGGRP